MKLNRTQTNTDITSNVYTNTIGLIKGDTVKDRMLNFSESFLNILTDANQPDGYVGIDSLGNANITTIKASTPSGKYLRDDGTWAVLGATWGGITGLITNQTDLITLVNTRLALSNVDTDIALTANSDSKVASQKAIKTYVGNQLAGYQPLVSPGTTSQYWRGDKTWQTLALATVLGIANTTGGSNIVMSGSDVITDSSSTSSFLDLNSQRLYFFDGTNRFGVFADLSSGVVELSARDMVSISLEHSYVQTLVNGVNIGAYSQASGNETKLIFSNTTSEISSTFATYAGLTYNADYSANYTNRSLVDKGYVTGSFLPLALSGNTTVNLSTYNLTFDAGANTARLILNATNATDAKIFSFRTAGSQRWAFRVDGAGDDFALRRYDNSGNYLDSPFAANRSTGLMTASNNIHFLSTYGIDTTSTGGTDVLNIGATNADVINIGGTGTTVNIIGTVTEYKATQSYVTDQLITINRNGPAASASGTGFEIEENAIITGYFKTNAGRDAYLLLAPAIAYYSELSLASLTANRTHTLPDQNGTFTVLGNTTTGTGSTLVLSTSPTLTTPTIAQINGVTNALTLNAATTLLDEMYLGSGASRGIWSWNANTVILRSGASAVNFTIGTPAYTTNIVSYNATGNVAIGGVVDNATDQLQVSNHIGTPVINLRGRSGAAPTQLNFIPFDATNSIITFKNTSGTTRGFIDLNIPSGEMKFWGSSGGYFPTFGSNGSERMRIDTNGNVVVNTAAIATNATNGFFYIPSCAGVPTGVPTAFTGRVPMVYDSTNNKFYIYSGAWKSVALA